MAKGARRQFGELPASAAKPLTGKRAAPHKAAQRLCAALPVSAERRTRAARARVRGEQKVRRGCEGSSIPYGAAFCRLRKGSDKLKAAVPDFCFPFPTFGNISHKYKRPPPEGPRRRFAPQSGLARPSSAGAAAFSALHIPQFPQ